MLFDQMKRVAAAVAIGAVSLMAAPASAVTLGEVAPSSPTPLYSDSVTALLSDTGIGVTGLFATGVGTDLPSAPGGTVVGLLTTLSVTLAPTLAGTFAIAEPTSLLSPIFLAGAIEDIAGGPTGDIDILFSVTGGNAAVDFGDLVLFTISTGLPGDPLASLTPLPTPVLADVSITSVERTAVVPLPASALLLLSGVGAIAVVARRRARA